MRIGSGGRRYPGGGSLSQPWTKGQYVPIVITVLRDNKIYFERQLHLCHSLLRFQSSRDSNGLFQWDSIDLSKQARRTPVSPPDRASQCLFPLRAHPVDRIGVYMLNQDRVLYIVSKRLLPNRTNTLSDRLTSVLAAHRVEHLILRRLHSAQECVPSIY